MLEQSKHQSKYLDQVYEIEKWKVLRMYLEKERLTEAFSEYKYRSYRPIPDLLMWVEMG